VTDPSPAALPIALEAVSYTESAVTILERINVVFAAGAPTIIVGPNGAGKTTLLRLAMGLLPPTQGCITWAGKGFDPKSRRGFVFQRPTMFRRTAVENIRYALNNASVPHPLQDAKIKELLSLVGLEELGARPARRMSGGEQQRVALARALAREPEVLFFDEPTASLDPAATKAFEDVVRAVVARGIKVVMSTHDLGEARRLAGDVLMLHRGRVIERGDAATFFGAPRTPEARTFLSGDLLV
jgi:tungstate transport system ATP-binding protein